MKVKPISDVAKTVMNMSLNFFKSQVLKRVKDNQLATKGVEVAFIPISNTITVLNDEDGENQKQVTKVVLDWVNQPLAEYLDNIFTGLIEKHDDVNIEKLLMFAKNVILGVMKLYSDDDMENNVQLKLMFNNLLQDPETEKLLLQNVFKPLIEKKIKDTDTVEHIIQILDSTFDAVIKK